MGLLASLPLWHLADLRLPDGVGDKRIIRGVSRRIGLPDAAALPKRAIQFGSRSSKCFKCNSDGNAHVDTATLSDQTAGRTPKKQRDETQKAKKQRHASKKNRGSQYPGRKADGAVPPGRKADGAVQASTAPAESQTDDETVPRVAWTGSGVTRPGGITADEFSWRYQIPNLPVVLCPPLPKSWGALQKLHIGERHANNTSNRIPDMEALLELAGADTVVPVDIGPADGSRSTKDTVRVQKTVREYAEWWAGRSDDGTATADEDEEVWYLKDWHLARDLGMAGSLYEPLAHFAEEFDWLNGWWDHLNDERSSGVAGADKGSLDDYRFVYLGPKGSWTPLHHDVLASYSWSANLCGVKRWLLFPPEATPLLYDKHGLNLAADAREGSADDLNRKEFPGLAKARELCVIVVQAVGETMFVPSGWHHQVHNEADTLSVNHNWFTSATLSGAADFLMKESQAVRAALDDLKPSEAGVVEVMAQAERAWMAQCERLQEANAAMGLGDFVRLLSVFSSRSAQKLLESSGRSIEEAAGSWRATHELEAARGVLKQLMGDRFVRGCPDLSVVAMETLREIEAAVTDPGAVDAVRQLRVLKMRHDKSVSSAAVDPGGEAPLAARVKLELAKDGHCKLSIDTQ